MRQPDNLMEALMARAEHTPDDVIFSCLNNQSDVIGQLSNQKLHTRAAAIAGRLQQIISPTDRVLLLFPQGLEFIYTFMGVMYSGAIPVIIAPPRDAKICHIQNIVEETGCTVVLTSTSILNEVMKCFFRSKKLSEKMVLAVEDINDELMNHWSMPLTDNNDTAYFQCTSAKKDKPKIVMISHHNMKTTYERIKRDHQLTTSSCSVSWLPHYHYLGLVFGILQPLYCGYKGYIYSLFDFYKNPHGWLNAISKYEATFSGAPDFAYSLCVEQDVDPQQNAFDLSRWNTAYNSGEPVKKKTMDAFLKKFSCYGLRENVLTSVYGAAEFPHVTTSQHYPENFSLISQMSLQYLTNEPVSNNQTIKVVGCGLPDSNTQVAIVVPGTRTKCTELEPGEILVSSACIATSYWNTPEATEKIVNISFGSSDDGQYFRTGDIGFIKEGKVYIVGKLNNALPIAVDIQT